MGMRKFLCAIGVIFLVGCASASHGFAGWGGVAERTDQFTGQREIYTGRGAVLCASGSTVLCTPGYTLQYEWNAQTPELIILEVVQTNYVNIEALDFNIDGAIVSLEPDRQSTRLTSSNSCETRM